MLMAKRKFLRFASIFTLVTFLTALTPRPVLAGTIGDTVGWVAGFPKRFMRRLVKPKEKISTPEEIAAVIKGVQHETFNANEAQRDEKADITLPAKRVGLSLLDGQLGTVKQFLSYNAASFINGVGKKAKNNQAWSKAGQVVQRMGAGRARVLQTAFSKSSFGRNLSSLLAQNRGKIGGFLRREGNFALMAFIGMLITYGIYDGMDIDTIKDRVVSVAPLCCDYRWDKQMPIQLVQEFLNRQLAAGFSGHFNKIYQKALSSKNMWGKALAALDTKSAALGQKLFAHSAKTGTESFAKKIGLVGVGEGAAFSLSGLYNALAVGATYGVLGHVVIESAGALVQGSFPDRVMLGGNRQKGFYAQQDINGFQYQKTGNKWKDGWRVRYIRLRDVFHNKVKWPMKTVLSPMSMFLGGFVGSVVAGALPFLAGGGLLTIVGGTLVSTLFAGIGTWVGSWAATKLDRSKWMMNSRRRRYVRRITREIKEMPIYRSGEMTKEQVHEIALARAMDFEKIEKVGQVSCRILIVDKGENIKLVKDGSYTNMFIDDKHGSERNAKAEIRYDVIDLEGNRYLYDIHTNKMRNVGKVAENTGRGICFVNTKGVFVEEDTIVNKGPECKEITL